MNKWLWYSLVVVTALLLLVSFLSQNIVFAGVSLILALVLKKYYHRIPLPKYLTKHKIYHQMTGKIVSPDARNTNEK